MTREVHIDDLAAPRLSEQQQAALDYAETLDIPLVADGILEQARRATGLHDFGPADFLPRLQLLCDEWSADKDLTGLGRLSLRNKLLLHAKNRLLIQDLLCRHPQINDVAIIKPVIVAGLPRSGTTHLLNLLAADCRLRALPLWESYEPVPMPGEQPGPDGSDPRFQRCAAQWDMMQQFSPLLSAMHPMNPEHIHEELELMGPDFASYNYEWLCPSPRWRDCYYDTDQTPHYEYMRTVLKILTWQDGDHSGLNTRWVLKCPQHLEQLPVVNRVFPDATVAITHRDPVSVLQSAATMLAYGQRTSRKRVNPKAVFSYWLDRIEHLLRACVNDRALVPDSRSIDIMFHQFMADEQDIVKKIYDKAGLVLDAAASRQIAQHLASHIRGRHGQVIYDLRRDFGTDPDQVRDRFRFYFEQFPVRREVT